jgi:hypothetical protein
VPRLTDADAQIKVGTMWRHNRTGDMVLVSAVTSYGEFPYVAYRYLDGRLYGQDEAETPVPASSFWFSYTALSRDAEHTLIRAGVWLDDQPTLDTGEGVGSAWVHRITREEVSIHSEMMVGPFPYVKLGEKVRPIDRKAFQRSYVRGHDPVHMLSCATERPKDRKDTKPTVETIQRVKAVGWTG